MKKEVLEMMEELLKEGKVINPIKEFKLVKDKSFDLIETEKVSEGRYIKKFKSDNGFTYNMEYEYAEDYSIIKTYDTRNNKNKLIDLSLSTVKLGRVLLKTKRVTIIRKDLDCLDLFKNDISAEMYNIVKDLIEVNDIKNITDVPENVYDNIKLIFTYGNKDNIKYVSIIDYNDNKFNSIIVTERFIKLFYLREAMYKVDIFRTNASENDDSITTYRSFPIDLNNEDICRYIINKDELTTRCTIKLNDWVILESK